MENLWKTNGNASNTNYVNIFEITRQKFGRCFSVWNEYINQYAQQLEINGCYNKDNQKAEKLLNIGHECCGSGNYRGAMQKYNEALSFAISGTIWESLAYKHRAACFMRLELYVKAFTDLQWALKFPHTGRTLLQLQTQLAECKKKLTSIDYSDWFIPKVNYSMQKDFPCLTSVLEIRENEEFGRHIVAKCDIGVGKVIMVSELFASASVSDTLTYCRICNKTEQIFVACAECPNAMYCRGSCANQIDIHRLECGSVFHVIDASLKLPIQTLLMAINMFPSIEQLMKFVEQYVGIRKKGTGIPKAANDSKSKYAVFLTLTRRNSSELIYLAYQVYTTLLTFPHVKRLINNGQKMVFLAHLALHHVTVVARNSFQHQTQDIGTIKTNYIYDVLSLINHSCSPNLFNVSKPDEITYCITVKPILAGEQVFINYLGNSGAMTLKERQSYLDGWNFQCNCERCEYERRQETSPIRFAIEADPAFQYVINTCQEKECCEINWESGRRNTLKQQCIEFLGKYGHMNWTPEIQTVVHCFTLH